MGQRLVLVMVALVFALSVPGVVSARVQTTLTGSVASPAKPTFPANLVVIAYQDGREVGRTDTTLAASASSPYPFSFIARGQGTFLVKAYIVDQSRRIFFQSPTVTYTAGITLALSPAPGTDILPRTSAGTVLVLVGVVAAIMAGILALRRRQRSRVLTQRFA